MRRLGCNTVADLQKVDVQQLLDAADGLLSLKIFPERDGKYLPLDPYEAYANGAAKDIDFMQGCTKDELNYFMFSEGADDFVDFFGKRLKKNIVKLTEEDKGL